MRGITTGRYLEEVPVVVVVVQASDITDTGLAFFSILVIAHRWELDQRQRIGCRNSAHPVAAPLHFDPFVNEQCAYIMIAEIGIVSHLHLCGNGDNFYLFFFTPWIDTSACMVIGI